jgi:triosephosphate isomerase (TIM)
MRKVLAGNWKMFKTRAETASFFMEIGKSLAASPLRKIIAPSPTLMESAVRASEGSGIEIFSQNCAWAPSGAFTGELSPLQLRDVGCTGTLVGHSERRQHFGDTDLSVLKRAINALQHGLEVIYCIGESLEERQGGLTPKVLKQQLSGVLSELLPNLKPGSGFLMAYEPVWAIGTGLTASSEQITEAHALISAELAKAGGADVAILYGGSVKPNNFREISHLPKVGGGLVGGASLSPADYIALHDCLK